LTTFIAIAAGRAAVTILTDELLAGRQALLNLGTNLQQLPKALLLQVRAKEAPQRDVLLTPRVVGAVDAIWTVAQAVKAQNSNERILGVISVQIREDFNNLSGHKKGCKHERRM
jgi:hypothetical protein